MALPRRLGSRFRWVMKGAGGELGSAPPCHARGERSLRWRRWDSNPRPPACKAGVVVDGPVPMSHPLRCDSGPKPRSTCAFGTAPPSLLRVEVCPFVSHQMGETRGKCPEPSLVGEIWGKIVGRATVFEWIVDRVPVAWDRTPVRRAWSSGGSRHPSVSVRDSYAAPYRRGDNHELGANRPARARLPERKESRMGDSTSLVVYDPRTADPRWWPWRASWPATPAGLGRPTPSTSPVLRLVRPAPPASVRRPPHQAAT